MGGPSRRVRLAALSVMALTILAGCDGDDASDGGTEATVSGPVEIGSVAATELVTGDCLVGIVIGREERIEIDAVSLVDCSTRHDLEVFTTFQLTADMVRAEDMAVYPGRGRVVGAAETGCNDALGEIGVDTELLGALAFWPSTESWAAGDRDVACAIYLQSGDQFDGRQLRLQPEDEGDGEDGT